MLDVCVKTLGAGWGGAELRQLWMCVLMALGLSGKHQQQVNNWAHPMTSEGDFCHRGVSVVTGNLGEIHFDLSFGPTNASWNERQAAAMAETEEEKQAKVASGKKSSKDRSVRFTKWAAVDVTSGVCW